MARNVDDMLCKALELTLRSVDAYRRAKDKVERQFIAFMIGEGRGHYMLVRDMQSYYEDPADWTRTKGRGGLDGA